MCVSQSFLTDDSFLGQNLDINIVCGVLSAVGIIVPDIEGTNGSSPTESFNTTTNSTIDAIPISLSLHKVRSEYINSDHIGSYPSSTTTSFAQEALTKELGLFTQHSIAYKLLQSFDEKYKKQLTKYYEDLKKLPKIPGLPSNISQNSSRMDSTTNTNSHTISGSYGLLHPIISSSGVISYGTLPSSYSLNQNNLGSNSIHSTNSLKSWNQYLFHSGTQNTTTGQLSETSSIDTSITKEKLSTFPTKTIFPVNTSNVNMPSNIMKTETSSYNASHTNLTMLHVSDLERGNLSSLSNSSSTIETFDEMVARIGNIQSISNDNTNISSFVNKFSTTLSKSNNNHSTLDNHTSKIQSDSENITATMKIDSCVNAKSHSPDSQSHSKAGVDHDASITLTGSKSVINSSDNGNSYRLASSSSANVHGIQNGIELIGGRYYSKTYENSNNPMNQSTDASSSGDLGHNTNGSNHNGDNLIPSKSSVISNNLANINTKAISISNVLPIHSFGKSLYISHKSAKRVANQRYWRLNDHMPNATQQLSWTNLFDIPTTTTTSNHAINDSIPSSKGSIFNDWMNVCYDEQYLLEQEETLLKNIAKQLDMSISQKPYRIGTNYLLHSSFKNRMDTIHDTSVHSHSSKSHSMNNNHHTVNTTNSIASAENNAMPSSPSIGSLRGGFVFTAASLRDKIKHQKKRKLSISFHSTSTNSQNGLNSSATDNQPLKRRYSVSSASGIYPKESNKSLGFHGIFNNSHNIHSRYVPTMYLNPIENHIKHDPSAAIIMTDIAIRTTEIPWQSIVNEFIIQDEQLLSSQTSTATTTLAAATTASSASLTGNGSKKSQPLATCPTKSSIESTVSESSASMRTRNTKNSSSVIIKTEESNSKDMKLGSNTNISDMNDDKLYRSDGIIRQNSAIMKHQDVLAPSYREVIADDILENDHDAEEVLNMKPKAASDAVEANEDISDEAVLRRHNAVLQRMRDNWTMLQRLRLELKHGVKFDANGRIIPRGNTQISSTPSNTGQIEKISEGSKLSDQTRRTEDVISSNQVPSMGLDVIESKSESEPTAIQPPRTAIQQLHQYRKRSHSKVSDKLKQTSNHSQGSHMITRQSAEAASIQLQSTSTSLSSQHNHKRRSASISSAMSVISEPEKEEKAVIPISNDGTMPVAKRSRGRPTKYPKVIPATIPPPQIASSTATNTDKTLESKSLNGPADKVSNQIMTQEYDVNIPPTNFVTQISLFPDESDHIHTPHGMDLMPSIHPSLFVMNESEKYDDNWLEHMRETMNILSEPDDREIDSSNIIDNPSFNACSDGIETSSLNERYYMDINPQSSLVNTIDPITLNPPVFPEQYMNEDVMQPESSWDSRKEEDALNESSQIHNSNTQASPSSTFDALSHQNGSIEPVDRIANKMKPIEQNDSVMEEKETGSTSEKTSMQLSIEKKQQDLEPTRMFMVELKDLLS